ncbi:MAG: hypothetical protein MK066_03540 [Crocinitomicaceae bacterium]|nr:hypothetical protein [Crocinitomicaceae bacterium]
MRSFFVCILLILNGCAEAQEVTNSVPQVENEPDVKNEVEEVDSIVVNKGQLFKPKSAVKESRKKHLKVGGESEVNTESVVEPKPYGTIQMSSEKELDMSPSNYQQTEAYRSAEFNFSYSQNGAKTQRTQRSPSIVQQEKMDEAVGYFQLNAPNSFEYHYYTFIAGNYDLDLISSLKEAERLRPNNSDVHVQLAACSIITNDSVNGIKYLGLLKEANRLSVPVIEYSKDLLRSTPENGTLITHGFDDSYGAWNAQNIEKLRSDVTLISLDFMQSDVYRTFLMDKGYVLPKRDTIDVDYFVQFCELNKSKGLGISMTIPKEYLQQIKDKIYVVGLVFEYHEEDYNNFYKNDYLWNEEFEKTVIHQATNQKAKDLSANYLPMLLQLRKVYGERGEQKKKDEVDKISDKVSVQCKKYERVQQLKSSY